ncbi:DNA polymerase IV [uncultured Gemmiger sp.]|uniref:DNA polymerase Y family protein n=1 Tax=uncultured Gemmiger sp. TaxID=1623490 RepID=UPI0025D93F48|nr:DNA polymerase IV [uncultured Gemmiger sp.]
MTVWFHVDVNSAFLSWSALKLLREGQPLDLRTVPAAVGGDEEKRHGVVLAKSQPAKKYGVQTGESLFSARLKCPELIVTKPDFDWYVQCSKGLIAILRDYSPVVEQFSIDEAFVEMTGSEALFGPPVQAADAIRQRVHRELGFTVNVGVSVNRLLAKVASDFTKPDRTHTLWPEEIPQKLWPLPVGSLFGVGPSAVRTMDALGIHTVGELAHADPEVLRRAFGVRGDSFRRHANGIEGTPLGKRETKDNSYGNSVTLPDDLARPEQADATLLALAESVAGRLRTDGKSARVVTVQLVDNAFRRSSHQVSLPNPTNSTELIYQTARQLIRQMWPKRPVRLVGITCERTTAESFEQLDLFTDVRRTDRQEKLDRTADALRSRFGDKAVVRARLLDPTDKPTAPGALSAAKARDKRRRKP